MSARTTRKARAVSATATRGNVVAAARVATGALGAEARTALRLYADRKVSPGIVAPATKLATSRAVTAVPRSALVGCSPLERVKVQAVLELASRQLVTSPASLAAPVEAFARAATPEEARRAASVLLAAAEGAHQAVFLESVTLACSKAAASLGFVDSRVRHNRSLETIEVVSQDADGRALITTVSTRDSDAPSMTTEVSGVRDGTCHALLDQFDRRLVVEGVQLSQGTRESIGAECQLAATAEQRAPASGARRITSRRQALNAERIQISRRRGGDR